VGAAVLAVADAAFDAFAPVEAGEDAGQEEGISMRIACAIL
jgi:hypothetical protein